jgi:hypothetical protein
LKRVPSRSSKWQVITIAATNVDHPSSPSRILTPACTSAAPQLGQAALSANRSATRWEERSPQAGHVMLLGSLYFIAEA